VFGQPVRDAARVTLTLALSTTYGSSHTTTKDSALGSLLFGTSDISEGWLSSLPHTAYRQAPHSTL